MQGLKYFFISIFLIVLFSCNSPYDQMLSGLSGQEFCLTKAEYDNGDTLLLGNGTLTLNKDQTFTIKTDSTKDLKLSGNWDLCCKYSDFGNYVFKVDKLPEWKQSDPNLFVLIKNKKVRLFFGSCKNSTK